MHGPRARMGLHGPPAPCPPPRSSTRSDKSIIVWELERGGDSFGYAKKSLRGHSHFVQDVVISSDGQFCLSGSWDGTLRLWDLNTGMTTRRFVGHTKDVLSVAFSVDNRQVGARIVHKAGRMHTGRTQQQGRPRQQQCSRRGAPRPPASAAGRPAAR